MEPKENKTNESTMKDSPHMKEVMGKDVAEKLFAQICGELKIDVAIFGLDEDAAMDGDFDEDEQDSAKKIITALRFGYLKYDNMIFTLKLKAPLKKESSTIDNLVIKEPSGVQMRGMTKVKKKRDDVGKAMAVLGEVTGLGLPIINKLGSRDLMVAVGVISLFL